MTRQVELAYWITARDNIRINKEERKLPPPWTQDPVMGEVRYCNVRREDDKVTRYLAENWRAADTPVWKIVMARMVNYIPSLVQIRPYWDDLEKVKDILRRRELDMKKVWTSAYTISTNGRSMNKIDYVFDYVIKDAVACEDTYLDTSLHEFHQGLTQVNGLGSFLAAQVVADLKNTPGHPLQRAPDWQTWAAPGPGSLRGLEAFYGAPIARREFMPALNDAWRLTRPLLPADLQDLHMQDFQNCMCEFSKYVRVKDGTGHARNKYDPGNS